MRIANPGPGTGGGRRSPWQPELEPNTADLIFKQQPQWLDKLELQVIRQTADIGGSLIFAAPVLPDSTTSGYNVPFARGNSTSVRACVLNHLSRGLLEHPSNRPMIFRFCSDLTHLPALSGTVPDV